jgi:IPT/TIG domain-containing protein
MILRAWKPAVALALSLLFLCITAVHASTPTITSLSPTAAAGGAAVTITGTSFGTQANGSISFNGMAATVTSWSATTIKVTVPSGATTGNVVVIASGVDSNGSTFTVLPTPSITSLSPAAGAPGASVTITGTGFGSSQGLGTVRFNGSNPAVVMSWSDMSIVATAPSGATTGNVAVFASGVNSNGSSFTVLPAPTITGLSVTSGYVGTAVTVTGTNFESTQGSGTVSFNGTSAPITSWSATSIAVIVPAGASSGFVVVSASGVNSNGWTFDVTPIITTLSPTSGAIGAAVTITGNNFGPSQGNSVVRFDGYPASVVSWSPTSIVVTVPNTAATGNVVVDVGDNSNGSRFTVVPAPSITSLSVTSGAVGTAVTITGGNFVSTPGMVSFNGTPAGITSWSATSIAVTVPNGATTGNVVVFASGVNSNGVNFTVLSSSPSIASLSQSSGASGVSVTITGVNFGMTQGSSTVAFGSAAASVVGWGSNSITVQVPSNASPGVGQVLVTTSFGSSNPAPFTVLPSITSLYPISAPPGASVTISGANFGSSGSVMFNGVSATITSWSPAIIFAAVPSSATTGSVVVTSNSTSSAGTSFTVTPAASILSISAPSGTAGTLVTITGSNFGATQQSESGAVIFNGKSATISNWASGSITAQVPRTAAPGLGTVSVSLAGNASDSLPFTVIPSLGTASSGSPGNPLLISGSNLGSTQGSGTVSFGGAIPQILQWSPVGVIVSVPVSQAVGNVAVSITTAGISTNTVNYNITPSITTISPAAAQADATVTITGAGFGSTGSIQFNGVSAPVQNWTSTTVTAQVPSGATTGPVLLTTSGAQSNPVNFMILPQPNPLASIAVQPASVELVVGDTHQLLAVDNNGATVSGATWSVDNPSLASISTDVPPILTAVADGNITLTATYQGFNAEATWTISGTALASGTPMWTLTSDGFTVQGLVNATPSPAGGADLFSIEAMPYPGPYLIRATAIDGSPVWSVPIPTPYGANVTDANPMPDPFGGLILGTQYGTIRLDSSTGQQDWVFTGPSGAFPLAVNPNSTVYLGVYSQLGVLGGSSGAALETITAVDATTGQPSFTVNLPPSYEDSEPNQSEINIGPAATVTGPFSVMPDGTTTFEEVVRNDQWITDPNTIYTAACTTTVSSSDQLYLVTVQQDGTLSSQLLDSSTFNETDAGSYCPYAATYYTAGYVIPDGQGGIVASWAKAGSSGASGALLVSTYLVSHIVNDSTTNYSIPYDIVSLNNGSFVADQPLVLGDTSGTIFATDNSLSIVNAPLLVAFDETSGQVEWTYQQTSPIVNPFTDGLTLIASTAGGGVVAKSTSNGIDTVLRFDSSGNVTADTWTASGITNFGGDFWQGFSSSGSTPSGYTAAPAVPNTSAWDAPNGVGGKAAKGDFSVSPFSQTGPNQTAIMGAVNEILTALPLTTFPGSPACYSWVQSGGEGANALFDLHLLFNQNPAGWGHGVVKQGGNRSYNVHAFSNNVNADHTPVSGVPAMVATTVNDIAGYFNGNLPLGPPYQGQAYKIGPRAYPGNTMTAQAEILLHEIGHVAITPPNFPDDLGAPAVSAANDIRVVNNCGTMIEALPSITGLSSTSGSVGKKITISGTNFGMNQGTNSVAFGNTPAPVTIWGPSSIVLNVPNGAQTGNVTVTVSGVPATGPVFTVQ